MSWFTRLFRREAPPAPEVEGDGVLFGLDPPEGCQFDVSVGDTDFWHVRIVKDGKWLAHACDAVQFRGSDRAAILSAAKKAMVSYQRQLDAAELAGMYPPKRTA